MSGAHPAGAPVQPAATVVLLREDTGEVLLLLRHARHGFMANVWVFPGGRVDEADLLASGPGCDPVEPFLHAAIRETWEEAGILLIDPPRIAAPDEPRGALAAVISRDSRFLPLAPFARWVTPPSEKRRYDTLFLLTLVPDLAAVPDIVEVIEALWIHPAEAIARHRQNRLPLAPPTLVTLHSILAASTGEYSDPVMGSEEPAPWTLAHRERLMSWLASNGSAEVAALTPTLALAGGRLLVSAPASERWPVPPALAHIGGVALVDGHWELVGRDPRDLGPRR